MDCAAGARTVHRCVAAIAACPIPTRCTAIVWKVRALALEPAADPFFRLKPPDAYETVLTALLAAVLDLSIHLQAHGVPAQA